MTPASCQECGTTATVKLVLADDGGPCFIAWCPRCADAARGVDIDVDDVPADLLAKVLAIGTTKAQ